MFDLKKYRNNIALIAEDGRVVYYRDILMVAERIADKVGSHQHIYVTASANLGMLVYYIAFLYIDNIVQVVDKELSYEQHLNYISNSMSFSLANQ